MTYGIVSILDDEHSERIEKIWDEFQKKFDIHGVFHTPIPHFSYHVAENYDLSQIERVIANLAGQIAPFTVKTTGLGLFTGGDPVLFVPVIRTAALEIVHQQVWNAIKTENIISGEFVHYELSRWIPHITLAHKDVSHDVLPQVIRFLSGRDFSWTVKIDNLSIIGGDDVHERIVEFVLRG